MGPGAYGYPGAPIAPFFDWEFPNGDYRLNANVNAAVALPTGGGNAVASYIPFVVKSNRYVQGVDFYLDNPAAGLGAANVKTMVALVEANADYSPTRATLMHASLSEEFTWCSAGTDTSIVTTDAVLLPRNAGAKVTKCRFTNPADIGGFDRLGYVCVVWDMNFAARNCYSLYLRYGLGAYTLATGAAYNSALPSSGTPSASDASNYNTIMCSIRYGRK